jgi:hypothetical protein
MRLPLVHSAPAGRCLKGKINLRSYGLTLRLKESALIPVARIKAAIRPVRAVRFPDRFRPGTVAL